MATQFYSQNSWITSRFWKRIPDITNNLSKTPTLQKFLVRETGLWIRNRNSTLIQSGTSNFYLILRHGAHFDQLRALRKQWSSISIMPLLATQVPEIVYLTRTLPLRIHQVHTCIWHPLLEHDRSLRWPQLVAADQFGTAKQLLDRFVESQSDNVQRCPDLTLTVVSQLPPLV
jgi:hypothetical protein